MPLDVRSRLEGIETFKIKRLIFGLATLLWMYVPVWRELKQRHEYLLEVGSENFGCTFPFGGN